MFVPPQRQRTPVTLLLIGLLTLCGVATVVAVLAERDAAADRDNRAAELVASRLNAQLQRMTASLRGVSGIAADGTIDTSEFAAFAREVTDDSLYRALAFATIVPDGELASFESSSGLTVIDTDGQGGFVDAAARPEHFVIVDVYPRTELTAPLLGFDIASDPARGRGAESARQSSGAVITEPISLASSARPGVFVIQAVRSEASEVIGFVSSGVSVDDLLAAADLSSANVETSLWLDDQLIVGTGESGATRILLVGGRTVTVEVNDRQGAGVLGPIVVAGFTLLFAAAVFLSVRRDRAQAASLGRAAEQSRAIAALGQRLAATNESAAVIAETLASAGAVVVADRVAVVRRRPTPSTELVVDLQPPHGAADRARFAEMANRPAGAFHDCLANGAPVVVADVHSAAFDDAALHATMASLELASALFVPLEFADHAVVGVLWFGWSTPLTGGRAETRLAAATTLAELCSRALERAVITELVRDATASLSALSTDLSSAEQVDQMVDAVRRHVPQIIGSSTADLRLTSNDELDAPGLTVVPVVDSGRAHVADLVLQRSNDAAISPTETAVLTTISRMIGPSLVRALQAEQRVDVIDQLQRYLLSTPPPIAHLDIATEYRPAMDAIGLGGDFFDVIDAEDAVFLVVGDVAGHGAEAVAAMAEIKSVMHHVVRAGASLAEAFTSVDPLLARRSIFASAQIVRIARDEDEFTMVNAGHPYPVVRDANGAARLLTGGHRPVLGVPGHDAGCVEPLRVPFAAGDLLVMYTDGLVERRSTTIDDSMAELATSISTITDSTAAAIAQRVVGRFVESGSDVDDDIALLVVRRR